MSSTIFHLIILLMAMVMVSPTVNSETLPTYTVDIGSNLTDALTVHCQSNIGDDIGTRVLQYAGHYSWKFGVTVDQPRIFSCYLSFGNSRGAFDAFIYGRDFDRCKNNLCQWCVNRRGVYINIMEGWKIEYVWKYGALNED
ncbi:hypothetical protein RJ640_023404 [Escallonia rubra]|uniref:S-protein homolog n=1 Tax=Escallonia rubra TaxID=112253 RepID=A0AA88R6L0_9ASTE|nr:hypothetical protein RJ640_003015 [Escallonia rubra]KAK2992045.1 hypothetical protein RJ640_023404 [Escallonia rubra]